MIGDGNDVNIVRINMNAVENNSRNVTYNNQVVSNKIIGDENRVNVINLNMSGVRNQESNTEYKTIKTFDSTNGNKNRVNSFNFDLCGVERNVSNITNEIEDDDSGENNKDMSVSAKVTGVSIQEGNISTGDRNKSNFSVSVIGTGESSGNVCISKPSFGVDVGIRVKLALEM